MNLLERYQGIGGQRNIREALRLQNSLRNDLEVIDAFVERGELRIYLAGEVLIRQGETDRDILYILTGEVSVEVNGDTSKRRRSGEHVGEMAMVDVSSVRSATIRAVVETAVLRVNVHIFSDLADDNKGFLWKYLAIEIGDRFRQRLADIKPPRRLVLLVHGIRTRAEWQEMVKERLEDEYTTVIPIKYGLLDLIRFWCPIFTRNGPIRKTEERLCRAIFDHKDHEIIVIAHSFGTYAISKILKRNPLIRIQKLILCGCIVSDNFKWGNLPNRPVTILNDCGHRDWYPVLASGLSFGYGATGVFGCGTSEVKDRFFSFGHSDFFTTDFIDTHWKPFVERGVVETSPYNLVTRSWFMSMAALKAFWLVMITSLISLCVFIIITIF